MTDSSNLSEYCVKPELVIVHDPTDFGAFQKFSTAGSDADLLADWLFREQPDIDKLHEQHLNFVAELKKRVRVAYLADILGSSHLPSCRNHLAANPNHLFTHDALITVPWVPDGFILGRMKKEIRRHEPAVWEKAAQELGLREMIRIPAPLVLEGGDVMPICYRGKRAFLVGYGPRTSRETLGFLRDTLVRDRIIDEIIGFQIAEWRLNIDGCFFPLAETLAVAHRESIAGGIFLGPDHTEEIDPVAYFEQRGFTIIEASLEESYYKQACNFACLGNSGFVAYNLTDRINASLRANGCEIVGIPGAELVKGNGGPHCMTRPIYKQSYSD
jgi:N-dimethylarginine dimethylaminohydrolase